MSDFDPAGLLDPPPFPADRVAGLADRLARLIGTTGDVLLVQAEAVVALEAAAASLGRPGLKAINIVTSPYGVWFGRWLRRRAPASSRFAPRRRGRSAFAPWRPRSMPIPTQNCWRWSTRNRRAVS